MGRGAHVVSDRELLTDAERKAIDMAGRLSAFISNKVCGHGPTREQDIAELEADVHRIQYRVMAQAAARLYPGELRLMGEVIGGEPGDAE
jgi:hypothetical protein